MRTFRGPFVAMLAVALSSCPKSVGRACAGEDDSGCAAGTHCEVGRCVGDEASGGSCDEASDCASRHCVNAICCDDGQCCARATDCTGGSEPALACDVPSSCQGHREQVTCSPSARCEVTRVDDDSACGADAGSTTCAPFADVACTGGVEQTVACPTSCTDDLGCAPAAHCSNRVCVPDLVDGSSCMKDGACVSGHCGNGFCCAGGDCCAQTSDCPRATTTMPRCDTPATCQGSRGLAVCNAEHRCASDGTVDEDSACTSAIVVDECGPFRAITCTGAASQSTPTCPTQCASHADCDATAFCDPSSRACVNDLANGEACGTEDARCASGHCQNGFCCTSGDCCRTGSDCPASYTMAAVCTDSAMCQGTRPAATCTTSQCSTQTVADDSACDSSVIAQRCGAYPSVACSGAAVQTAPSCATSCQTDPDCDADAHCTVQGRCESDVGDGTSCGRDAECQSGHCQNGFCCASGDCCRQASDCTTSAQPAQCDSATTCQGHRVDATCTSARCGSQNVDDDSACAGSVSNSCGPYPSVLCSAAQTQTAPTCAMTCVDDSGCDVSAHCAAPTCVPDTGLGGFCTRQQDCASGTFCVDSVCCNAACSGLCEACDLPGSVGSCTAIPSGQDPDAECGAASCVGFFHSWSANTCRRKADVPASVTSCNGARACRTTTQECTLSTTIGPATTTCTATCQTPTAGTCTDQTAGACTNVNPGTQTCGTGLCRSTVNQCSNGAPITCVPGTPQVEVCNSVDDNCDGTVDNGPFSDGFEPSGDCSAVRGLPLVGSNANVTYSNNLTLYAAGDVDTFAIPLVETDSSCGCGALSIDEDYSAAVTVTVPGGAGSYEVCMNTSVCSFPTGNCFDVAAGTSVTISQFLDGDCLGNDSYTLFVRIRGGSAPGFSCQPYSLRVGFTAGLCR